MSRIQNLLRILRTLPLTILSVEVLVLHHLVLSAPKVTEKSEGKQKGVSENYEADGTHQNQKKQKHKKKAKPP